MRQRSFAKYIEQLDALSRQLPGTVPRLAHGIEQRTQVVSIIEAARAPRLACPRCAGTALQRHGIANALQRFRCKACGRTFNSLTGTPLARLRLKDKWLDFCETMLDPGATVCRAARQVGVHKNTSFRWRHRMLALTKLDRRIPLRGIVEADEMYILESQKGARRLTRPARRRGGVAGKRGISGEQVCTLVARDRAGRTHDAVTGRGPVSAAQLARHLAPVLERDVILVTDGHASYRAFARASGILHEAVKLSAGERGRGVVHVQNVNAYHSRLRGWLHHFRGVATRYLDNYCGWRWAIDLQRLASPQAFLRSALGGGAINS